MKVSDIGLKDVHCAAPGSSLADVASMMKRHNVGIVPICEGDRLLGVITDRDIVISCVASNTEVQSCNARGFMTANPITIAPDADLADAAHLMAREQIHRLPVVQDSKLVGLLSLSDVAMALMDNDSLVADTLRRITTPTHAVPVC